MAVRVLAFLAGTCILLSAPVVLYCMRGGLPARGGRVGLGAAAGALLRGPDKRQALELHVSRGRAHLNRGQYEAAARQFSEALALAGAGDLAEVRGGLGTAYLRQGRLREAEEELHRAYLLTSMTGPSSHLLQMLGNVQRDMGRLDRALPLYVRAMESRREGEDRASLLNDHGRIHLLRGELDEAGVFFEAARSEVSRGQ